jgi:hypothetical protein
MPRAGLRRRAATTLAAAAAAALLGGCGTATPQAATSSPAPTAAPATATATATATAAATASAVPTGAPSAAPASVQVTDADNGGTVAVAVGGTVTAVLHSTYWQFDPPSDPAVLRAQGPQTTSPAPRGTCVPGGGCGTVTATFRALRPGRSLITAERTSCGEALRCTGGAGHFSVTVVVSG